MRQIAILIFTFIIWVSCSDKSQISYKADRFIKASITDKGIRDIYRDYSKRYSFLKQGVLISNLVFNHDTSKCLIYLVYDKEFLNKWLKNKNFVLYDTIDNRIVIISTRLESFLDLKKCTSTSDTILDRYLQGNKNGLNEINEYEYKITKDTFSRKIVYFDPIY